MSFYICSQEAYVLNSKTLTDRYRKLQSMVHPDKFNNSDEVCVFDFHRTCWILI